MKIKDIREFRTNVRERNDINRDEHFIGTKHYNREKTINHKVIPLIKKLKYKKLIIFRKFKDCVILDIIITKK